MGKAIVYTSLVIVCLGVGLIVGGLGVYYGRPYYEPQQQPIQTIKAKCFPVANGGGPTIKGEISLSQTTNKDLVLNANLVGLPPKKLGFHIHSFGVVDNNCSTAGGHFNPEGKNHGGPDSLERHMGDLGNLDATQFPGEVEITDNHASLLGKDSIMGRSIVIHESEDDLKNQSSAGGRLACCTIIRAE